MTLDAAYGWAVVLLAASVAAWTFSGAVSRIIKARAAGSWGIVVDAAAPIVREVVVAGAGALFRRMFTRAPKIEPRSRLPRESVN